MRRMKVQLGYLETEVERHPCPTGGREGGCDNEGWALFREGHWCPYCALSDYSREFSRALRGDTAALRSEMGD